MGERDYAIVVGITYHDPELNTLKGPENDARDFYKWVISPSGGAVPPPPKDNAKLILSSDFKDAVEPTAQRVNDAINDLYKIAEESDANEEGFKVGRRLYFYMAGHGVAPSRDQTAILMADATKKNLDLHILGQYSADCMFDAGMFDEILLFIDCCRETSQVPVLNRQLPERFAEKTDHIVRFYSNASVWRKRAREKQMPHDNQWHGVFTTALLSGLSGAARDPGGNVTGGTLYKYLKNFTQSFFTEEERKDSALSTEPDIDFQMKFADQLVITKLSWTEWAKKIVTWDSYMNKLPVKISLPDDSVGMKALVLDRGLKEVSSTTVKADSLVWEVKLEPGFYTVLLPDGRHQPFAVGGEGEVNVVFNS